MHATKTTSASDETTQIRVNGAKSLPQKYFISPEVFAEEQQKIFAKQWLLIGHQSQIPKPGDYFVQQVIGESLIVIRDKDRDVRSFFNVCRHRGTRLKEDA